MKHDTLDKLKILAGAAKYDVSCSSSGSRRPNKGKGLGNAASCGVCHSWSEDGRCISLLKILMTNYCIYDCAYCINRRSNDIERTTFTVNEIVNLTTNFYRRNYIEGLFLSSGVLRSPDFTMELLTRTAKQLRKEQNFNGYIHLKSTPGVSHEALWEAGLYADRLSVNIEIPSEQNLILLAPEKNYEKTLNPMGYIKEKIIQNKDERRKFRSAPLFSPAGQSTQMIIGATPDSDFRILNLSSSLYKEKKLKRVYYSAFLPVNSYDKRLPALTQAPLVRENRLYQADWLMRFYRFTADEIVNEQNPFLDPDIDPKLGYALRNPAHYPVDINSADYEKILRVPGIGVLSAKRIIHARRFGKLGSHHLTKIGVVMKRAKYFITCGELPLPGDIHPGKIKKDIFSSTVIRRKTDRMQLSLFPVEEMTKISKQQT